jgi:hypothetical protein
MNRIWEEEVKELRLARHIQTKEDIVHVTQMRGAAKRGLQSTSKHA